MTFRKLNAEEIECRMARKAKNGLMLLLYKDARCDMKILDETVGAMNWQRSHEVVNGNLFCNVGIRDGSGEWVWKQDVGTESNTEKEKGQASDSFKRACFNWGIGRELYTAPTIWINNGDFTTTEDGKVYDRFDVTEIAYDESGNISHLKIKNEKLKRVVFTFDKDQPEEDLTAQINTIKELCTKKGKRYSAWLQNIGKDEQALTGEDVGRMLQILKDMPDKEKK